jgi:hypothetical protein
VYTNTSPEGLDNRVYKNEALQVVSNPTLLMHECIHVGPWKGHGMTVELREDPWIFVFYKCGKLPRASALTEGRMQYPVFYCEVHGPNGAMG